jgi:hypothetical protein
MQKHLLTRRDFQISALQGTAATLLHPLRLVADPAASPDISGMYRSAIVIDSLCCLFVDDETPPGPALVKTSHDSGITAVHCTGLRAGFRRHDQGDRFASCPDREVSG